MGTFKIEVKGAKELAVKFENMSRKVEKRVKEATKKRTYEMEARAKELSPYDTGHLERSIHSDFYNGGLTGETSTNVNYAIYQEMGTRYMAAQPFMFPAFIKARSDYIRDLHDILKELKE